MTKRKNGKELVLATLRDGGPQTIAEIATKAALSKECVRYAIDALVWANEIHYSGKTKKFLRCEAHIFEYGPGDGSHDPEEFHRKGERQNAMAENQRTVERIRNSYIPGIFDPFRVLRVQVGV